MVRVSPVKRPMSLDRSQVRQHFSCHAREYDNYAKVQQKVATNLTKLLLDQQEYWQRGLEVGCGTGLLSRRVVKQYPELPMVFSDLAHGMSLQTQHVLPGYSVCDADAANLPYQTDCFDLVLSSSVYQWLEDLLGAFTEIARVLMPGGLFAIALFGERTLYELRSSHQLALRNRDSHGQKFPDLLAVSSALEEHFDTLLLHSEDEVEWHADVPQLLRCLKRIGAQNANRNRPQGLASRKVMQGMIDLYQSNFGSALGIPATYEVIYLLAKRKG